MPIIRFGSPTVTGFIQVQDSVQYIPSVGTLTAKYNTATNGTATVQTVTAAKKLYLTSISGSTNSTVGGICYVYINDDTNQRLYTVNAPGSGSNPFNVTFPLPVLLAAGATIKIVAPANTSIYCCAVGYEVTA